MKRRTYLPILAGVLLALCALVLAGCGGDEAQLSETTAPPEPALAQAAAEPPTQAPTEPPTEAPTATEPPATEAPVETTAESETGAAAPAVELIAAWVDAGAAETEAFDYTGVDGNTYQATFAIDILPLFTQNNAWFEGAQACTGCHFAASENSYHEMNLSNYDGIRAGADSLEEPPGVSILGESEPGAGDFDWDYSKLRERLRNNRMPPGWEFDISEENRNGPCLALSADGVVVDVDEYDDCEQTAVGLLGAWVEAGAPDGDFEYGGAALTFERDVLPFFTEADMWFDGSQACTGCHFAASENSYHEMDLSSYAGIRAGADSLEEPPGVSILGESEPNAGDFDWSGSKLRARLRNNRMAPGWEFDITEGNRNGPLVLAGKKK